MSVHLRTKVVVGSITNTVTKFSDIGIFSSKEFLNI